jgi:predicted phosphodiesterase
LRRGKSASNGSVVLLWCFVARGWVVGLTVPQSTCMLLLHISDIHFRKEETGTAMDPNLRLRSELIIDASERCKKLGPPDAVLVSGDVAFGGQTDEYQYALGWLKSLCDACGTSLSAVFVCPGNHDVSRSITNRSIIQSLHRDIKRASDISLDPTLRGLLTDAEAGRLLYESIGAYNAFAVQFFCELVPPDKTVTFRDLTLNDSSRLRLWGLNSAFVSSSADKKEELFVDPAYGQIVREVGTEHLVMCHHPCSWLRRGQALADHINDVARLHLFGHEHVGRIELVRDYVRIAAGAMQPSRDEANWEPGYNLIELSVEGAGANRRLHVGVHVRVWQTGPGQFRAKLDKKEEVFKHQIPLDAWTPPAGDPIQKTTEPVVATQQGSDPMKNLRDLSIRFFRLTLSQKSAIAGKLGLLEEEDANVPFQSTLPTRAATRLVVRRQRVFGVSIHAAHAGSDEP